MTGFPSHSPEPHQRESGMMAVLRRLRSAAKAQLIVQRGGLLLAGLMGVGLVLGGLDYLLRFPTPVRFALGLVGLTRLVARPPARVAGDPVQAEPDAGGPAGRRVRAGTQGRADGRARLGAGAGRE